MATKDIVKKNWYRVVSADPFPNAELGESMGVSVESLVGRPVRVNMMVITNNPQSQNVGVDFVITGVSNGAAVASPVRYFLMTSAVKRAVRRNRDKIDESVVVETIDKQKVRIKPMLITRGAVTRGVLRKLRSQAKEFIKTEAAKLKFVELFNAVSFNAFQKGISSFLKKTYPIAVSDIRMLEIVKEKDKSGKVKLAA